MKVIYSDIKKIYNCLYHYLPSWPLILLKLTKFPVFENPKRGLQKQKKDFSKWSTQNSALSTKKYLNKVKNYKVNFQCFALCLSLRRSALLACEVYLTTGTTLFTFLFCFVPHAKDEKASF